MTADLSSAIPALGSLTAAEICVVEAARRGICAELSPHDWRTQDALTRLKEHASTVRPSVIRYLLLGGDQNIKVHEHGVSVKNAYIAGEIDLEGCNVELKLTLLNCYVEGILNLTDARTRTIDLGGSRSRQYADSASA
jgi:hypothetical protein